MSVTRTFTVTVVATGSGNKYFIDGAQQATVNLGENYTYKFDQSDSSNSSHPLRFSTTSNGTWSGGSQYTTGVTTNGTPGQAGAYTQISVAASAPTLYYYCTNHSGMGGQANTPDSDTWGLNFWNVNTWNQQDGVDVPLTGISATTSLGIPDFFPEQGWGRDNWNDESWGESSFTVEVSGLSATTAIGSVTVSAEINTGWGRSTWDADAWGIQGDVLLTGQSATSSVGSISPADVIGVTGVSGTSSLGSPTIISDISLTLTGQSATSSLGSVTAADVMAVTGVSATSSVGSMVIETAYDLTGLSATISLGNTADSSNPIIILTSQSATSSLGSLAPADVMGLTGLSATSSIGTPSLTISFDITLTGQSATSNVAAFGTASGFGIQAYQSVDTGSNTSYTDVA